MTTYVTRKQNYKFNPSYTYLEAIQSELRNVQNRMHALQEEHAETLSDIDEDELIYMIEKLQGILSAVRGSSELKELYHQADHIPAYGTANPVEVTVEGELLRINTPLTIAAKKNNAFYIASQVSSAMDIYEMEHPGFKWNHFCTKPFMAVQIRKEPAHRINSYTIKDNNNEDGAIINAIVRDHFMRSDSVRNMVAFTNIAKPVDTVEEQGMEFIIFPVDQLHLHLRELRK